MMIKIIICSFCLLFGLACYALEESRFIKTKEQVEVFKEKIESDSIAERTNAYSTVCKSIYVAIEKGEKLKELPHALFEMLIKGLSEDSALCKEECVTTVYLIFYNYPINYADSDKKLNLIETIPFSGEELKSMQKQLVHLLNENVYNIRRSALCSLALSIDCSEETKKEILSHLLKESDDRNISLILDSLDKYGITVNEAQNVLRTLSEGASDEIKEKCSKLLTSTKTN